MQAPYNDRWERTKRYLLRNFLVNPGFRLSPIPEEERSSPDSGSLPDLVLEPAPDRHDHPPDFYEGLERRMKRYYRQLFLGANESDESSDFEVNRSMASTFMLDTDDRKDNEANVFTEENREGYLDDSIAKKRRRTESTNESDEIREVTQSTNESDEIREVTQSTNESDEIREVTQSTNKSLDDENQNQDKSDEDFIDTCATYDDTRHVSADSKSSSVDDEENLKLIETRSIIESIHSYKSDDPNVDIDDYGDQSSDKNQPDTAKEDRDKKRRDLNEISFKSNETKSDSEDASLCHRISTTVAQIHEERPRRRSTQVFGSPVLIPRLLQFSKRVFGSRKSGESFNVSEASDDFIRRLTSRKSGESNKHDDDIQEPETQGQRLLAASELTRASLGSDKLDTEHMAENIDTEHKNQEDVDKNDNIEDRATFEDIIQPHDITRASLTSNKPLDTENIDDYADTEKNEQEDDKNDDTEDKTGIEDIIQPHEITRASLASDKTLDTENIEDYGDTEENDQEYDKNDDIEDRTGIENIIQPHEITRASLSSNKTLDTENIEDYADTEENEQEDDTNGDIEDRSGIEAIMQPHEMTGASLPPNKQLDTENIEHYADTEEQDDKNDDIEDRIGIEDIIQPHEMTRASLPYNKTFDTENIGDYTYTGRKKQEHDKTYDVEDKSQVSEIQTDNEEDEIDKEVDNESDITAIENTSINWNKDGVDDNEDSFENSVRRGVFARKARKMTFISSSDESFHEMEPIAHSSANSIEYEEVEVMREAREAGGNERRSWHGEAVNQGSPALAFEARTNASDKSENDSSNSTEINASFEEIEKDTEDPQNTNDVTNIIDEFWSVSPEDVDIESPKEVPRSNKRKTDSATDKPSKRKKKDIAIQTGSEDNCTKWENVRSDFFVGTPLIFRLCGCQDHVCS